MSNALVIPVYHDFICPWCWIGWIQAKQLSADYGVSFEWRGAELYPVDMDWPAMSCSLPPPKNKPVTPSRIDFLYELEGIPRPSVPRPDEMRTNNAHQAVEYAKTVGVGEQMLGALYEGLWLNGLNISEVETIVELSRDFITDRAALVKAIASDLFGDNILDFDAPAYSQGIYNVPTFLIGDKSYAEQPSTVLGKAIIEELGPNIYQDLVFHPSQSDRPYIFLNMVSTIDGKIVTGGRDEHVMDLGSKFDHQIMRRLEEKADAILVGANSLRVTGEKWNPPTETRIVFTRSGNLDYSSKFLSNGNPIVIGPASLSVPKHVTHLVCDGDLRDVLAELRKRGIRVINLLGGSNLNAQFFEQQLIDEVFMTVAPKIKLGEETPTIAGGNPLARENVQNFDLLEVSRFGNEVFLRYKSQLS